MAPLPVAQAFRPAIRRFCRGSATRFGPAARRTSSRAKPRHISRFSKTTVSRRGMTADEARVAARRAFGGVEQMKDRHRDARSFVWLDDARRDVRHAARLLRRIRSSR